MEIISIDIRDTVGARFIAYCKDTIEREKLLRAIWDLWIGNDYLTVDKIEGTTVYFREENLEDDSKASVEEIIEELKRQMKKVEVKKFKIYEDEEAED